MAALWHDLRYALRVFAKNPGLTAVAVLSLALAIGPNSTLFSVVDSFLLRPSPVKGIDQLYVLYLRAGREYESITYPDYLDLRNQATVFSDFIACERRVAFLTAEGNREMVMVNVVSENYFSALGVRAALGRTLVPGRDEAAAASPPIMISHGLWMRRFASDPGIVGKTILLERAGFTVAGVAPRDFRGPGVVAVPVDIWLPLSALKTLEPSTRARFQERGRRGFNLEVEVRLRPGVSRPQAQAELNTFASRLADAYPAAHKARTVLMRSEGGDEASRLVLSAIVLGLVGLVVLIACANVANLLMAHAETRRREIAVRLALGAGRARLVRQLLTEGALLSMAAAAAGLMLAWWLLTLLPALKPPIPIPLNFDIRLDARALGYTLLVSLATVLVFGLLPAMRATRPELAPVLNGADQNRPGRSRFFSARNLLVIGQIALSQLLLTGAALFLQSYLATRKIPLGFDPHRNLVMLWTAIEPEAHERNVRIDCRRLIERVRSLPGITQTTLAASVPMGLSGGGARVRVSAPGTEFTGENPLSAGLNRVGPDYCRVMGARLLRGREFEWRDDPRRTPVVLVNETMARLLWRGREPVGQWLRSEDGRDYQVLGVVEDGKYSSIYEEPRPFVFFAMTPEADAAIFLVETASAPAPLAPVIRRELAAAEPNLRILDTTTMQSHMNLVLFLPRMSAGFIGAIGALAILLAAVGLYSVVSYAVARRAHEIGVRMAMGARPRNVLGLILGQSFRLVAAGVGIGIAGAFLASRALSKVLYGVSATGAAALAGSAVVVAVIALVATQVPAHRAARLDPMSVLRRE